MNRITSLFIGGFFLFSSFIFVLFFKHHCILWALEFISTWWKWVNTTPFFIPKVNDCEPELKDNFDLIAVLEFSFGLVDKIVVTAWVHSYRNWLIHYIPFSPFTAPKKPTAVWQCFFLFLNRWISSYMFEFIVIV